MNIKKLLFLNIFIFYFFSVFLFGKNLLTLEEAYQLALKHNLSIKKAALELEKSKIDHSKINFFPNLYLGASYDKNFLNSKSKNNLNLIAKVPINILEKTFQYKNSKLVMNISEKRNLDTIKKSFHNIAKLFYAAWLDQEKMKILEEKVILNKVKLELDQTLLNEGKISKETFLINKIEYDSEYSEYISQKNNKKAIVILQNAIGMDLVDVSFEEPNVEEVLNIRQVEKENINEQIDELEVLLKKNQKTLTKLAVLPSLDINIGCNVSEKNISFKNRFSFGISLGFNIFSLLSLSNNTRKASLECDYALFKKNYNRKLREKENNRILENYEKEYEVYIFLKKNLEKSKTILEGLRYRYQLKKISLLDLKISESNLLKIKLLTMKKIYDLKILEEELKEQSL